MEQEVKNAKNQQVNLGAPIMIGLIVLGLFIFLGIKQFRTADRIVSVKGLCEKEVAADRAIYPISYFVLGNDVQSLYSETKQKNSTIVNFLQKNGIEESEITISAPSITDTRTEYNNNKPYNYSVKTVITVYTTKVDVVRDLIGKQAQLMNMGIVTTGNDWENRTQFMFTGLNNIKPEMIEEATANARASAEKFAKDSKSKLGKIKQASQGQFSISDRDENTPYIKTVRVVTSLDYFLKD